MMTGMRIVIIVAAVVAAAGCGSVSPAPPPALPQQQLAQRLTGTVDAATGAEVTSATVSAPSMSSVACTADGATGRHVPAAAWTQPEVYTVATGEVFLSDGEHYPVYITVACDGAVRWTQMHG